MSRTQGSSKSVPSSTRITRRATVAPRRALRIVGEDEQAQEQAQEQTPAPAQPQPHQAFELACLPHQAELFGVAMRICRDPDTAKDLVQETLLRAMVAWASFQPGSNLRAWLFRILTNAFINGYRKRRRHQRFATERPGDALAALYGRDQDHTDDLEDEMLGEELCDEVKTALGRLGPEYRDVVERADLRGEKYKDIADALSVPIGTVMSRLFRARRALEGELASFAQRDYGIRRAA
ncbi:MAG TPA: sigma-70 family RNA polymerase sigma factor [Kofleriaceae bacterium]|nr:sigma-70 family RNA polymerase sigma factor [Kofleriaceae bacterium]